MATAADWGVPHPVSTGMSARHDFVSASIEDEELLRTVVERLVGGFHPERIVLFGSRARGTARTHSDLDLLVVMPSGTERRETQIAMRRALRDLRTSKDIIVTTPEDIDRRGKIPGLVLRTALREGVEIYARA